MIQQFTALSNIDKAVIPVKVLYALFCWIWRVLQDLQSVQDLQDLQDLQSALTVLELQGIRLCAGCSQPVKWPAGARKSAGKVASAG